MEWEHIEAAWPHYGKLAQHRWDRLSQQELAATAGNRERLLESIAHLYGVSSSEAEGQLAQWQSQQTATPAERGSASMREDVEENSRGYCDDDSVPEAPGNAI